MFCADVCKAQEQIQITEKLPDGSIILTVDGVKYRALTVTQLRQIQENKANLESCSEENSLLAQSSEKLKSALRLSEKNTAIAVAEKDLERKRGDEFKKLFEDERALRLSVNVPPKNKNIIEKILSHPVTQIALVAITGAVAAKK